MNKILFFGFIYEFYAASCGRKLIKVKKQVISHSFIHIPGIGKKTEKKLWSQGITSMHQLLDEIEIQSEGYEGPGKTKAALEKSVSALEEQDWTYFYQKLPSREHWRLLNCFSRIAYLDIETTGLGPYGNYITVIGVYDGSESKSYIYGKNLEDFMHDIKKYDAIVTYNGKTFDLPFIKAVMNVNISVPHIDLRYVLASLGYKGGLKKIEPMLGIERDEGLKEIDGFMAVELWHEYNNRGNENALETLLAYNVEDIVNLKPIAERTYNMKLPEEFRHLRIPETAGDFQNPYRVDKELVGKFL